MPQLAQLRADRPCDGASHMRSTAWVVFGNGMTSRIDDSPASRAQIRSSPSARPPCGGVPYSSASRKKPKRVFACLIAQAEQAEHRGLRLAVMDADAAAAQLPAVQDDVVGLGQHLPGIGFEPGQVFLAGRGERVVHRVPAAFISVPVEEREVGDPEQLPAALGNQVPLPGHRVPQLAEHLRGGLQPRPKRARRDRPCRRPWRRARR